MAIASRGQTIRAALILVAVSQPVFAVNADSYEVLVRQYLIARHCELVTTEVMDGFRIEIMSLLESEAVSANEARARRRAAGEAVRQGWRNRGQGPRDPRCLIEGRAAAARFVDVLHERN